MEKETIVQKLDKATKAAKGKITSNLTPDDSPKATQGVLNMEQSQALYAALQPGPELDEELAIVLDRVRPNLSPVEMMHATQSVLNLMHAKSQAEALTGVAKQPTKVTKTKTN